jgi:hypothetical protein
MTYILAVVVLFVAGCLAGSRIEHGTKYPLGERLVTSCVVVRSFAPELRSAPRSQGPDTFVGYFDHGPGMPRGPVFLVLPTPTTAPASVGELLRHVDPKGRAFWLEARLTNGTLDSEEPFEAIVPAKQRRATPNGIIVEREALLVRGRIHSACGRNYLVAIQANPAVVEQQEWPIIRKNFDLFLSSLQWPK